MSWLGRKPGKRQTWMAGQRMDRAKEWVKGRTELRNSFMKEGAPQTLLRLQNALREAKPALIKASALLHVCLVPISGLMNDNHSEEQSKRIVVKPYSITSTRWEDILKQQKIEVWLELHELDPAVSSSAWLICTIKSSFFCHAVVDVPIFDIDVLHILFFASTPGTLIKNAGQDLSGHSLQSWKRTNSSHC